MVLIEALEVVVKEANIVEEDSKDGGLIGLEFAGCESADCGPLGGSID